MRRQEGPGPERDEEPTIRMSIPAAYQYLNVVGEAIRALLERAVSTEKKDELLNSVELAVHEACTNIVKHAYAGEKGTIELTFTLADSPRRVVVATRDTGRSFDLRQVSDPDLDAVQDSGYGIFLIRKLMDEVTYHSTADGNRWCLVKRIE